MNPGPVADQAGDVTTRPQRQDETGYRHCRPDTLGNGTNAPSSSGLVDAEKVKPGVFLMVVAWKACAKGHVAPSHS